MKRVLISVIALVVVHFSTSLIAQIPRVINYQGMLLGSDEQPVAERDYKITFNLYDDSNNLLWSEVHNKVFVGGGMFHVLLGTVNPLGIPFDKPYFLGIQVENDPELQPRMMMTSAAYSFRAEDADKVAGIQVSTTPQPNTLLPLDGSGKFPSSVLSGGAASGDFLRKNVPDTTKGSSSADMLRIENTGSGRGLTVMSSGAHGIFGKSSSNQAGVEGENSGTGAGVRGSSQSHNGTIGVTNASDKAGVFDNSSGGIGVWGNSVNNHAVFGQSTSGRGVKGVSPAGGVFGESTQGVGVEGRSNANDGVVGWTNNPQNSGVFGNSPNGIGVTGQSAGNDGLLGVSTSSNAGHAGVHARNDGAGPAVYSEGDLFVTGGFRGNIGPNGGAPFPKPAYDSGWVSIANNENKVLTHNLGGSEDNYVVDLQKKSEGLDINNANIGWDSRYIDGVTLTSGARWHHLTASSITVERASHDGLSPVVRVRIWVYK